jgi:hypothetical protein
VHRADRLSIQLNGDPAVAEFAGLVTRAQQLGGESHNARGVSAHGRAGTRPAPRVECLGGLTGVPCRRDRHEPEITMQTLQLSLRTLRQPYALASIGLLIVNDIC